MITMKLTVSLLFSEGLAPYVQPYWEAVIDKNILSVKDIYSSLNHRRADKFKGNITVQLGDNTVCLHAFKAVFYCSQSPFSHMHTSSV